MNRCEKHNLPYAGFCKGKACNTFFCESCKINHEGTDHEMMGMENAGCEIHDKIIKNITLYKNMLEDWNKLELEAKQAQENRRISLVQAKEEIMNIFHVVLIQIMNEIDSSTGKKNNEVQAVINKQKDEIVKRKKQYEDILPIINANFLIDLNQVAKNLKEETRNDTEAMNECKNIMKSIDVNETNAILIKTAKGFIDEYNKLPGICLDIQSEIESNYKANNKELAEKNEKMKEDFSQKKDRMIEEIDVLLFTMKEADGYCSLREINMAVEKYKQILKSDCLTSAVTNSIYCKLSWCYAVDSKTQLPKAIEYLEKASNFYNSQQGEKDENTAYFYYVAAFIESKKEEIKYKDYYANITKAINLYGQLNIENENTALACHNLSYYWYLKGDLEQACDNAEKAIAYYGAIGKQNANTALTYASLALYHSKRNSEARNNDPPTTHALKYGKEAYRLYSRLKIEDERAALAYINLSTEYSKKNKFSKAIELSRTVLGWYNRLQIRDSRMINLLINLSVYHYRNNSIAKAIDYGNQAVEKAKDYQIEDPLIGQAYDNLADYYMHTGEVEKAIENEENCIKIYKKLNLKTVSKPLAYSHYNLAGCLEKANRLEDAQRHANKAKSLYKKNMIVDFKDIDELLDRIQKRRP